MNIFILSDNPFEAAAQQCDKHVVKMVVESAQMLSTVHRILDGTLTTLKDEKSGRVKKHYAHPSRLYEDELYKAVHMNHPCTVWTALNSGNYEWHYSHWVGLATEYNFRYGKVHASFEKLRNILSNPPRNIVDGDRTTFPLAMNTNPECQFPEDPVKSYRMFYQTKQERFSMVWTQREVPEWFKVNDR